MVRRRAEDAEAALARAQDLVYDAWEAPTPERSVEMAIAALAISRLCADAYSLLAGYAKPGSHEERELWESAVEAGRKAIGEAMFKECVGEFWGILETRPYMRARFGLAETLWKRGAHEEAVDHLSEMLALNPNDNQGVRYSLLAHLTELGQDASAAALVEQYKEEHSAFWAWTRVLLTFRRGGDRSARKLIAEAIEVNQHVRDYLCGERAIPRRMPPYYGMGDRNEAIMYGRDYLPAWRATEGAVEWLRVTVPTTKKPGKARSAKMAR